MPFGRASYLLQRLDLALQEVLVRVALPASSPEADGRGPVTQAHAGVEMQPTEAPGQVPRREDVAGPQGVQQAAAQFHRKIQVSEWGEQAGAPGPALDQYQGRGPVGVSLRLSSQLLPLGFRDQQGLEAVENFFQGQPSLCGRTIPPGPG